MRFVYLHVALFGFWVVVNLGWVPGVPAWDPSFVGLAMVASVEAIFLSTFVLISQNRMVAAADKRADLDLQISLLAQHEVTRLVTMMSAVVDRMGVKTEADGDLEEITQDVAPRPCSTSSRQRGREPSSGLWFSSEPVHKFVQQRPPELAGRAARCAADLARPT